MRRWLLPEAIEDALPAEAARLEALRRRLLDLFACHGYEQVMPPLLEYLESLLIGSGRDLDLRTFKLVDQLSGRSIGVRADITPQVARIDAHLLARHGVARLCYCGSVLHTTPASLTATREPLQIGAELYGHAGMEADAEVIALLAEALCSAGLQTTRIDLGHVGVFRALAAAAGVAPELEQDLHAALQAKDVPGLRDLVAGLAEPYRSGLLALPECYGEVGALADHARRLPDTRRMQAALRELDTLLALLGDLPVSVDLSDLRGYHYHSGVVFSAYCAGHAGAIACGGRYDDVGRAYGRGRPATGFSLDLRELARVAPNGTRRAGVLAPAGEDGALRATIARLRAAGETVVIMLPGHTGTWREAGCDRRLVARGGQWDVVPVDGDE